MTALKKRAIKSGLLCYIHDLICTEPLWVLLTVAEQLIVLFESDQSLEAANGRGHQNDSNKPQSFIAKT